jgi:2,4-dienoyl-CoA reductase-like NADH-dependent reductase (Old Yellow Enzyme family)
VSVLFSPLDLGQFTLSNRIAVAPMCQYSAADGCATDWHLQQVMQYAMSGAGLVVLEATAVERRGRITHGCLGLYSDDNEAALARVLAAARGVAVPGTRFAIQLAHAGRKGSTHRPWDGSGALGPGEDSWPTVASSAVPFAPGYHTPAALDEDGMARIRLAFVRAAQRAVRLGFDAVELHSAHGYLFDTFLSPLANTRTDQYGGSFENRVRFPLSVARAVKAALPSSVAFSARITGTDWVDNKGWTPDEAALYAAELKAIGAIYISVSTGGIVPGLPIPTGLGYQVPPAAHVKAKSGAVTATAGHIVDATQAEDLVASGQVDMVMLARAILDNPRWPWHAADRLGAKIAYPPQFARVNPALWKVAPAARPLDFPPAKTP